MSPLFGIRSTRRTLEVVGVLLSFACLAGCGRRLATLPVVPLKTEPIVVGAGGSAATFGQLFCGVLLHTSTSSDPWGYCERYFRPAGTPAALGSLPSSLPYRVMVVPGIFGECVEGLARPFEDARRHLSSAHGIDVEYVGVSALGSSAHNAAAIGAYLQRQFSGADRRPYIAFGYSKGASDLLEAVSTVETAKTGIAAVVTVAGSVLGSRLADDVPRNLLDFLEDQRLGTCSIGDGGGIDDLRRASRADALVTFQPPPRFRAYSIAAVSDPSTTSRVLQRGWDQLRPISIEQDSQVIHEDAIVPGGTYLGIARGDHWAVALPFEDVPQSHPSHQRIIRAIDQNHYPREALFEAALRHVLADLSRS